MSLDSDIRYGLSRPYSKKVKEITLDLTMVGKMCRVAVDTELLKLVINDEISRGAFESVLETCLRILGK